MRLALLNDPPLNVPAIVRVDEVPAAPTEPGKVNVAVTVAPAATRPTDCGSGVPEVVETLPTVSWTLNASDPPVLEIFRFTTTWFDPLRDRDLVTTILAGVAGADGGSTLICTLFPAEL
jgi:hypothetical protein